MIAETSTPTLGRLLRKRALLERLGISAATLYRLIQRGEFPRPVKIGARAVAWREDAAAAWLAGREAASLDQAA